MRLPLISFAVGTCVGGAIRASMAHGDLGLFFNPFFPLFPAYFQ